MSQKDLKKAATKTYYEPGTAIRGEKVTAQARKLHRKTVTAGTSTHEIQELRLEGSVFCIIDRPLNFIRDFVEKSEE
jgi:uncharacterized membrane protein YdbT with pleckstrin-like domain